MARITVEDCLENVENLFQLVLVASNARGGSRTALSRPLTGRTTSRPWSHYARSRRATSALNCSRNRKPPPEPTIP